MEAEDRFLKQEDGASDDDDYEPRIRIEELRNSDNVKCDSKEEEQPAEDTMLNNMIAQ